MSKTLLENISELDYELPSELIAQYPAEIRSESKLMLLPHATGTPSSIGAFGETILDALTSNDLVIANNARVLNARIPLVRSTGGKGEVLLLAPSSQQSTDLDLCYWEAMARPARKYKEGMFVGIQEQDENIRFIEQTGSQTWIVELPCRLEETPQWLQKYGKIPLPPYITERNYPDERYQTVHAEVNGSVAAPTAGLHFDDALWQKVKQICDVSFVTLHVGAGTFLPVTSENLSNHMMHHERFEVSSSVDEQIRDAMSAKRRIVSIGTTTARVLESVYGERNEPLNSSTDLFIRPGYKWSCVGALLTNFHLPKSTLLALVMAFQGIEETKNAYAYAIREKMRFYSFGDAMFLEGPARTTR